MPAGYSCRPTAYNPDLSPIEKTFAKLKALPRKVAEQTVDGPWAILGRLIDALTPITYAHDFSASGYDPDRQNAALANFPQG